MQVFKKAALFLIIQTTVHGQCDTIPKPNAYRLTKAWDVQINEIMADPDPGAGNITYPEYVELYNKQAVPVNMKNWKFCVGAICKSLPDVFIPADSFMVLTASTVVKVFPAEVNVTGISGFQALANAGQTLQLQNEKGNIISAISYSDDWYRDEVKKKGGFSLEQLDAENPCAESLNWKASVNITGGTPGKINSVIATNKDSKIPEMLRVNVLSPDRIEVNFTEALDSTTLNSPATYDISGIGTPVGIALTPPHFKSIILYLPTALKEATMYTLTIKGKITDCAGNSIRNNSTAKFAIPAATLKDDIVINELLFNPRQGGADFIEIYNTSEKVLELKTLFLCHYDTTTGIASEIGKITTSGYLFFPGEYLVLTEDAAAVKKQYRTEQPDAFLNITDMPALNADAGNICLKTASAIIDHFTYTSAMHFALLKDTKGISLERVNFRRFTNDVTNWHSASSSVDFATPGYKNSQFSDAAIVENPMSVRPEIFSPNNDGIDDLVTIYLHFDKPEWSVTIVVYDSSGKQVRMLANNKLMGAEGSYSWDGINDNREKERTGIYVLYVKVFNLSGVIKQYKKVCVLNGKE